MQQMIHDTVGFPGQSQWAPSYLLDLVKANGTRKPSQLVTSAPNLWHCPIKATYYPVSSETFSYKV